MPFEAILREVEQLRKVGTRLEKLADQHPHLSATLIPVAETVRNASIILEVLVATRGPKPI